MCPLGSGPWAERARPKPTALTAFDSSNRAVGFSLRAYPPKKEGRAEAALPS